MPKFRAFTTPWKASAPRIFSYGELFFIQKVGVEFLGIDSEKKRDLLIEFPNLKSLTFEYFHEWEEWNGIEGEEEEEENCIVTIMPSLQYLKICYYPKLKLVPNFLLATPLQKL